MLFRSEPSGGKIHSGPLQRRQYRSIHRCDCIMSICSYFLASNLWFAATQSIIDMPRFDPEEVRRDRVEALRRTLGDDLEDLGGNIKFVRMFLKRGDDEAVRLLELDDDELYMKNENLGLVRVCAVR